MIIDFKTRAIIPPPEQRPTLVIQESNAIHDITDGPLRERAKRHPLIQDFLEREIRNIGRLIGRADEIERRVSE